MRGQQQQIHTDFPAARRRNAKLGEKAKENLQKIENTRHLKIWCDHSEILNHGYFTMTISTTYDKVAFITTAEYLKRFPERPL